MGKRPNANLTDGDSAGVTDGSPRLIHIEFPKQITPFVWLAMVVGLLLMVGGFAAHIFVGSAGVKENLSLASGVAVILSAFGGQATVRGKAFVFAGSAGIAAALFYFLNSQPANLTNSYVQGRITNLPVGSYQVQLKFSEPTYANHSFENTQFQFVALASDITKVEEASLEITKLQQNVVISDDTFSIPVACFKPWIGIDKLIDWHYDPIENVLREAFGEHHIIAGPPQTKTESCTTSAGTAQASMAIDPKILANLLPISSAQAAELYNTAPATDQIDEALASLNSANNDVRRGARDVLSRISPQDVRRVLDYAQAHKDDAVVTLGISVGLTELLRRDKTLGAKVTLTQPDIDLLLNFATSTDRTLRIYSGEFLYDLGSPDVAKTALSRAAQLGADTARDDARFNLLFVAQDGYRKLPDEDKKNLAPAFTAIQSTLNSNPGNYQKTQSIFNNLIK